MRFPMPHYPSDFEILTTGFERLASSALRRLQPHIARQTGRRWSHSRLLSLSPDWSRRISVDLSVTGLSDS